MRSGFVCLLAAAGCNSLFGSHDVINGSKDADVRPKDAAPYTMYLTGMNVDTTTNADPTMVMPTFPPLVGASVAAGPVGQPTQPLELAGDGSFTIPFALAQGVYRIVYTPPDAVPVELQEQPQAAHFVVPSIGRPDAVLAPTNAMIGSLQPMNGPSTFQNLHLFSIGTFAARIAGSAAASTGSSTEWSSNASTTEPDAIVSMSGGMATPDSSKGDRIVVVDGANGDPDTASGFSVGMMSAFDAPAPYADLTLSPWQTTAMVSSDDLRWQPFDTLSADSPNKRVFSAATNAATSDATDGSNNLAPFIFAGVAPNLHIPAFLESGAGWNVVSGNPLNRWAVRGTGGVDVPVFLPMSRTVSTNPVSMIRAFDGTTLPAFPTAMYVRFSMTWKWKVDTDPSHDIPFTEGIQSVTPVKANQATMAPLGVSVGIADTAAQHMMLGGADIWTPVTSSNAITATGTTLDFTYTVDGPIDDCVATVYRLDGSSVVPVHRFLSTVVPATKALQVDRSIFDSSHDYVVGVVCQQGLPGVKPSSTQAGYDWTQVAYPFMESTLYSYPFHVQ